MDGTTRTVSLLLLLKVPNSSGLWIRRVWPGTSTPSDLVIGSMSPTLLSSPEVACTCMGIFICWYETKGAHCHGMWVRG